MRLIHSAGDVYLVPYLNDTGGLVMERHSVVAWKVLEEGERDYERLYADGRNCAPVLPYTPDSVSAVCGIENLATKIVTVPGLKRVFAGLQEYRAFALGVLRRADGGHISTDPDAYADVGLDAVEEETVLPDDDRELDKASGNRRRRTNEEIANDDKYRELIEAAGGTVRTANSLFGKLASRGAVLAEIRKRNGHASPAPAPAAKRQSSSVGDDLDVDDDGNDLLGEASGESSGDEEEDLLG